MNLRRSKITDTHRDVSRTLLPISCRLFLKRLKLSSVKTILFTAAISIFVEKDFGIMDPINIIIGINIIALFGANVGGAKKGLKSSISQVRERSKTYLQQAPPWLATFVLLVSIIWLFPIGAITYTLEYNVFRMPALIVYLICSWLQVLSYKQLGENYSQEIVIFKNHKLVQSGLYRIVRHPQYALQIITDVALTIALINYVAAPFVIAEIPLFIMRSSFEDKLMQRTFPEEFEKYKSKTGFMIPFIG